VKKRAQGKFAEPLEMWFAAVKRPMPWRTDPTPYACWLSEIMMQQTTYASVLPYYTRFLKLFPTVAALAAAEESSVLKAWEGLGYYARARNLHKAAQAVVASGRAVWPTSADEWSKVPGVGPYTAAALASVLNGERIPVVDGNVARVFARVWELDGDFKKLPAREKLAAKLQSEIERSRVPGDFNQAMMELGALVCTPKSPSCESCPLAKLCAAKKNGTQDAYPVRTERRPVPVRKEDVVIVSDAEGRVLLVQNTEGGLLKGLWELPAVSAAGGLVHVFSHFKLELNATRAVRTDAAFHDPRRVPLATATRKMLVSCGLLDGR
jgi:A/G-specific adenine glycosylase